MTQLEERFSRLSNELHRLRGVEMDCTKLRIKLARAYADVRRLESELQDSEARNQQLLREAACGKVLASRRNGVSEHAVPAEATSEVSASDPPERDDDVAQAVKFAGAPPVESVEIVIPCEEYPYGRRGPRALRPPTVDDAMEHLIAALVNADIGECDAGAIAGQVAVLVRAVEREGR